MRFRHPDTWESFDIRQINDRESASYCGFSPDGDRILTVDVINEEEYSPGD